jgi:hypothetical protein
MVVPPFCDPYYLISPFFVVGFGSVCEIKRAANHTAASEIGAAITAITITVSVSGREGKL